MPYQVLQPYALLHANCSITFLCAFMVTNHNNSTIVALAEPWSWQIYSFHLHALRPTETEQELSFSLDMLGWPTWREVGDRFRARGISVQYTWVSNTTE